MTSMCNSGNLKRLYRLCAWLLVSLLVVHASGSAATTNVRGWHEAGSDPGDYQMFVDQTVFHTGKSSGCVQGSEKSRGFGTLMQSFKPDEYRGKRIRMSAFVKHQSIRRWAGLWLRVDVGEKSVSFDNMKNRPFKGTQDWGKHNIVLDVPVEATNIAFGILLSGSGTVWVDDFNFEVVDHTVPTTDSLYASSKPENLSFEAL